MTKESKPPKREIDPQLIIAGHLKNMHRHFFLHMDVRSGKRRLRGISVSKSIALLEWEQRLLDKMFDELWALERDSNQHE